MRLSQWRKSAPTKESLSDRVLATLKPVLVDLGEEPDPECWVTWGDDPARYSILAPTRAGLVTAAVRLGGPEEGPRVNGKLTRWPKLTVSELNIESSGGHRIVAVQIENLVLKGVDDDADRICVFVRDLIARIDNRVAQPVRVSVAGTARVAAPAPAKKVAAAAAPTKRVAAAVAPAKRPVAAAAPKRAPAAAKPAAAPKRAPAAAKPAVAPKRAAGGPAARPARAAARAAGGAVAKAPAARPARAVAAAAAPRARKPARGSGLALVPAVPAAPEAPAAAASAATSAPADSVPPSGARMPIAARAATATQPGHAGAKPAAEREPEVELPEWVSPHPIAEPPAHEPPGKPRPWMP